MLHDYMVCYHVVHTTDSAKKNGGFVKPLRPGLFMLMTSCKRQLIRNHKKVQYTAVKQEKALRSTCGGVALQSVA